MDTPLILPTNLAYTNCYTDLAYKINWVKTKSKANKNITIEPFSMPTLQKPLNITYTIIDPFFMPTYQQTPHLMQLFAILLCDFNTCALNFRAHFRAYFSLI